MIQEIKIKNFLSFKDEVKFSFEASNDKFAEDSQVVQINENTRLLRFAIVYGYNASGKSNLLSVIQTLHDFWFKKPEDVDERINIVPFKLDVSSPNQPSEFEIVFYVDSVKYCYHLVVNQQFVHSEKLYYYKSSQPTLLFDRAFEDGQSSIHFNPALKISSLVKENITVRCLKNMSLFSARNQINTSIPLIDVAKDWLKSDFLRPIIPTTDLTSYAQKKISNDRNLTKYVLGFLHEADFNITNIKTDVIFYPMSEDVLDMILHAEEISKEEKERIAIEKSWKQLRTEFEHTVENERGIETYQLSPSENEESRGTMRTFGIEAALYYALKHSAFMSIDEIETSLHPKLLEMILYEYLKTSSRSQLLVTTHNDGLLDLIDDLIRKDSVWFTEKDKAGVTDLYKLTDFRGVNRLSSIREAYRNKRFGATMK